MSEELRPVGDAVKILAQQVIGRFNAEAEQLAVVALKDAGLSKEDGWRFDIFNGVIVKQATEQAEPNTEA